MSAPRKPLPASLFAPEVNEEDVAAFRDLVSLDLIPEQVAQVVTPASVYPAQRQVVATHWHPEHVPMELIRRRVDAMFPGKKEELIIPTQHNVVMEWDGYAGVEVDCYSRGFSRKVQLLIHAKAERLAEAHTFRSMLEHTRRYRASQLYEFLDSLVLPAHAARVEKGAAETGACKEVVAFCRAYALRLKRMLVDYAHDTPADVIKNKLIAHYVDTARGVAGDLFVERAQTFLKAVKKLVKDQFPLQYFYLTSEIIEEARSLGCGIVIPHPEQFWPILLADYDVDGYEVWNPQSREYTEFLIQVVRRHNAAGRTSKPLLIFMGDDCHMGEKTRPSRYQNQEKTAREIGYQPAWDEAPIMKALGASGVTPSTVIAQYRERLN
ncbi:MAG: hypothetical protein HQK87_06275 [Nitrospinae bacterium]|nr:hypothetical protein [Nitrospinota bacterium]